MNELPLFAVMDVVPVLPARTLMALVAVKPVPVAFKVAEAVPEVLPRRTVPVPKPAAFVLWLTVPLSIVTPAVNVLVPLRVRAEVALFCVTPVTFVPMTALISVFPAAVPEFVTVPVLFNEVPEIVTPFAVAPLFSSVRLKAPVMPPVIARTPVPAFWIVEAAPSVKAPLTVLLAVAVERAKIPDLVPVPPIVTAPARVITMGSSKLMLLAARVPEAVTVPVV